MSNCDIDWSKQPLGEVFDITLAKNLGVSIDIVRKQRKKKGIIAYRKKLHKYTNWKEQPLGKMSDLLIGERLGVPVATVKSARQRQKIKGRYRTGAMCRICLSIDEVIFFQAFINAVLSGKDVTNFSRRMEFIQIMYEIHRVSKRLKNENCKVNV